MKILIEITTHDKQLSYDIIGNYSSYAVGTTIQIPGNASLTSSGIISRKAFAFPETLEFILTFGTGVASGMVASWLYDKLKGKATRLRIEKQEIQIDQGEIKRILSYEAIYRDKIKIIKYEDLVMDTEAVIKEICSHVDLEFQQILLTPTSIGREWCGDSNFVHQRGIDKDALVRWKEYWEKEPRETFCLYLDRKITNLFKYGSDEHLFRGNIFRKNNALASMRINRFVYKFVKTIKI